MTEGERLLLDDLNDFVRQTSDQLDEQDTSSGIRPNPVIEVTEQTLDTSRFGLEFAPQPLAEVQPDSQGGGANCCNREITEVNYMTLTGTFTVVCEGCSGECEFSRTWTRIPSTESFNDDFDQFWLYTQGPTCQLFAVFSQGDFLHPTALCHDGVTGLNGSTDLNEFLIFPLPGDFMQIKMQFQVTASGTSGCASGSCNGHSEEFVINVAACDVSDLLGDRVFTKSCDSSGCHFEIEGHVIFTASHP